MVTDQVSSTLSESIAVSGTGMLVQFIGLIILTLLILVLIKAISSMMKGKSKTVPQAPAVPAAPAVAAPAKPAVPAAANPAPAGPPSVTLIGVDEPTAAVIMALVSHNTDIPLERLSFKTIKKIQEGIKQ